MNVRNFRGSPVLVAFLTLCQQASAGEDDRYRYVLETSSDTFVCRHMDVVFTKHFTAPWKRPALAAGAYDPAYGPEGSYAFPRLPGVAPNRRMTFRMSYSKLPTSPEFEAIEWKEGRYRFASRPTHDVPMITAEIDIDNDGIPERVIKTSFMTTFDDSGGRGGEDVLLVFADKSLDVNKPVEFGASYVPEGNGKKPALITALPGLPYRQIRPFVLNAKTYLTGYEQRWPNAQSAPVAEFFHVLRYRGVRASNDPTDIRNVVEVDRICSFRMQVTTKKD